MPQMIEVPGMGVVEFPDGMDDAQIVAAIQRHVPAPKGFGEKLARLWENPPPGGLVDTIIKPVANYAGLTRAASRGEVSLTDEDGRTSPETIAATAKAATVLGGGAPRGAGGILGAPERMMAMRPAAPAPRNAVVQAASDAGLDAVPRAIATESPALQRTSAALSSIPVAGEPIRRSVQVFQDSAGNVVRGIADDLGGADARAAGEAARSGVTNWIRGASREAEREPWDAVRAAIDPSIGRELTATKAAAQKIVAERESAALGPSKAVETVSGALERDGGLTFDGLKRLRTGFDAKNERQLLAQGFEAAEVRAIRDGLTRDLESLARHAGGDEAVNLWKDAVAQSRLTNMQRTALQRVIGRDGNLSDEQVFGRLSDFAGVKRGADARRLQLARQAMGPQAWDQFVSAKLATLGRAGDDAFSFDRFVTGWSGLSDAFKAGMKPEHRKAIESIYTLSRASQDKVSRLSNTSRTTPTLLGGIGVSGLFVEPISTLQAALGSYVVAKALAAPVSASAVAKWAQTARTAQRYPSARAAEVMQVANRQLALALANATGGNALSLARQLNGIVVSKGAQDEQQQQ